MERFIFDLDGTMLNARWSEEDLFFIEKLGKNDGEAFNKAKRDLLMEYEKNHYRYNTLLLSNYFKENGFDIDKDLIRDWIVFNRDVINSDMLDGVVETLDYLKEQNVKMSLLTNWFSKTQKGRLERAGLIDYFDTFVCGEDVLKPNTESFMLAAAETPIEECVMIGDNFDKDFLGAINVGMSAFLIKDNNFAKVKKLGGIKNGK